MGRRQGEKLYEELLNEEEAKNAYENSNMLVVLPNSNIKKYKYLFNPKNGFK
ncbi:polysaccharide biosynthesis protein, partial [Patescibacteria group bacterium]